MNIHEYVRERNQVLEEFEKAWCIASFKDPEKYPMQMQKGDEGLWDEMFEYFLTNGKLE